MSAKRCSAPRSTLAAPAGRSRWSGSGDFAAIEQVLAEAIAAGGSTLRDFASPDGELGYFSKAFAVYDREGERCACGGTVRRIVQGGRSTFYCTTCQR